MPIKSSKKSFSLISRPKLLALYAAILRCRMLVESATGRGSTATHEAAAVAVAIGLRPVDTLVCTSPDALPHFIKGAALGQVLQQLRAPAGAPMVAQLRSALTAARAHQREGKRKVAAVFCGDASLSSPAVKRVLRAASAERLPMIFVHQADADLATPAAGKSEFGLPAIAADRDDLVALYRVASEAIAHARRGNGPTLIECAACRPAGAKASMHETSGDETSGSVAKMERYLAQAGISGVRRKARATAEFERELRGTAVSARSKRSRVNDKVRV